MAKLKDIEAADKAAGQPYEPNELDRAAVDTINHLILHIAEELEVDSNSERFAKQIVDSGSIEDGIAIAKHVVIDGNGNYVFGIDVVINARTVSMSLILAPTEFEFSNGRTSERWDVRYAGKSLETVPRPKSDAASLREAAVAVTNKLLEQVKSNRS